MSRSKLLRRMSRAIAILLILPFFIAPPLYYNNKKKFQNYIPAYLEKAKKEHKNFGIEYKDFPDIKFIFSFLYHGAYWPESNLVELNAFLIYSEKGCKETLDHEIAGHHYLKKVSKDFGFKNHYTINGYLKDIKTKQDSIETILAEGFSTFIENMINKKEFNQKNYPVNLEDLFIDRFETGSNFVKIIHDSTQFSPGKIGEILVTNPTSEEEILNPNKYIERIKRIK